MATVEIVVNLIDNASAGLTNIGARSLGLGEGLQATGATLMGVGTALTMGVTAPAALAVGGIAKVSGEFEQSMLKVQALTGASSREIADMSQKIPALAAGTSRSANELAEAYYYIASSGFQAADEAFPILEASAKAAASGMGETKDVADAVTSVLSAYGLSGEKAAWATDVLTKAVLEGKAESDQFAGSIGRVLPIASAMGVSFEEVAAHMAMLTRIGLSADESATALRGTLNNFEKPSKMVSDNLAKIGMTADGVRQSIRERGLLVTLDDLIKKTEGGITVTSVQAANWEKVGNNAREYGSRVADLNTKLNQQNAQLALLESNLGKTSTGKQASAQTTAQQGLAIAKLKDQIGQTNGAIAEYNRKLGENAQVQDVVTTKTMSGEEILGRIIPNVRALTGVLGTAKSQGEGYARALDSISQSSGSTQRAFEISAQGFRFATGQLKATVEGMLITLGPRILPVLSDLAHKFATELPQALGKLLAWWDKLSPETQKFVAILAGVAVAAGPVLLVVGALISALGVLISPVGAVIAVVTLLGAAWASNFMDIRGKTATVLAFIQTAFANIVTWFTNVETRLRNSLLPAFRGVWDFLTRFVKPILEGVADVLQAAFMYALGVVWDFLKAKLVPVLTELHKWFAVYILPALKDVAAWLSGELQRAFEGAQKYLETVRGALESLYEWADMVRSTLKKVADAIRSMPKPSFSNPFGGDGGSSGSGGEAGTSNYDYSMTNINVDVNGSNASPGEIAQAVSDSQWP